MVTRRRFLAAVASLPVVSSAQAQTAPTKTRVVATFSILADLARQVGGDRVDVVSIVGPDADAHAFQPTPGTSRLVSGADLVVTNGLGLEGWIGRLITASGSKAPITAASKDVKPLPGGTGGSGHRHRFDPHAWHDVANVKTYVVNLRDGLIGVDRPGRAYYEETSSAYLAQLARLEDDVRRDVAAIPPDRRKVITTHDAFGYFGNAYGLRFVAPQGVSTETEASAKDVALIIRQIKQQNIPAVFIENISDPRLIEQIARETGARIGGKLFSDALSEADGPARSYLDMVRSNVSVLQKALV